MGCDAEAADYLRYFCRQQGVDLRPYLSADVCKLIIGAAQYERVAPVLERQSINRVLALYSTKVVGGPGGYGKVAGLEPAPPGAISTFGASRTSMRALSTGVPTGTAVVVHMP
ncbi:MAG: hypothetical protein P8I99_15570 [Acidimicrobiales bacterium]|nr:hypothetical protein [Acidimicrobiales bacterium]MDG1878824.1 hypothetical protein [Acidimicrobiales bacterium]